MPAIPALRPSRSRVFVVLLAGLAVVAAMLSLSHQAARADTSCPAAQSFQQLFIAVSGPAGPGGEQVAGVPVQLAVSSFQLGALATGQHPCGANGEYYTVSVEWSGPGITTSPQDNPVTVVDAAGPVSFSARVSVLEHLCTSMCLTYVNTTVSSPALVESMLFDPPGPQNMWVSVGPSTPGPGQTVQVSSSLTDVMPVTAISFDFGDGSAPVTDTTAPTHTYDAPGTFIVTFAATDAFARNVVQTTVHVLQPLTPGFTVSAGSVPLGSPVHMDAGQTVTDAGLTLTYGWDFGDGSSGSGVSPSHLYATTGTYTITETATDSLGRSGTATHDVTVTDAPVTPPPVRNPPLASWTASPGSPVAMSAVSFDGTGSTSDGSIVDYAWNFGDGSTGTGATPQHTYTSANRYPVSLTVTDDAGSRNSHTDWVVVADAPPTAAFTTSPAAPVAASTVSFDGSGSSDPDGSVQQYAWDFGDGATGTGKTPTHAYAKAAGYDVVLTVTDDAGLTATMKQTVVVAPAPPVAVFTPPTGAAGQSLAFDATASTDPDGSIASYSWDFGDGTSPVAGGSPGHTFAVAGTYPVTLTVTDGDGLADSVTHLVTVGAAPLTATFLASASAPQVGTPVLFDASGSAEPGGSIASYAWTFGDGGTATGVKPSHTYATPGSYPVTLTVTDAAGNTASVTHVVTAHWPATDLAVAIGGSTPKAGQFTYRVTLKNLGHTGAHGIVLTTALDPTQVLASVVSAPAGLVCGGVPVGSTGTVTCKAPAAVLAAGNTWVVTFTVRQPSPTRVRQVTETSAVRAANPDPVVKNNTARLTTAV